MYKKFIATLVYTSVVLASNMSVNVNLSPAGSFEIKSNKIIGSVSKQDNVYSADKINVPVKSFSTGLDLRDKHTKEKLNYKKYPSVKISNAKAKDGKGTAKIKIMDVEKNINFKYSLDHGSIKVSFTLKLSDFSIEGISYMGIGVKDEIDISANLDIL